MYMFILLFVVVLQVYACTYARVAHLAQRLRICLKSLDSIIVIVYK